MVDGGDDVVPCVDEVVAAGVGENAEAGVGGVGREDVADELVAEEGLLVCSDGSRGWAVRRCVGCWAGDGDAFVPGGFVVGIDVGGDILHAAGAGEAGDVEDCFEIAIAMDERGARVLKACLGELGFDEEIVELHVDLGAVCEGAALRVGEQGDARVDSEAGRGVGRDAQECGYCGSERGAVEDSRVAENVHQEGVGAVGGVELHPGPVGESACAAVAGMGFRETSCPAWVGADVGP